MRELAPSGGQKPLGATRARPVGRTPPYKWELPSRYVHDVGGQRLTYAQIASRQAVAVAGGDEGSSSMSTRNTRLGTGVAIGLAIWLGHAVPAAPAPAQQTYDHAVGISSRMDHDKSVLER